MEQNRIERLQYFFRHFSLRLYERYEILITFEEYLKYCNKPHIKEEVYIKHQDGRACYYGYARIKGEDVRVYRQTQRPRALLTALPKIK